MRREATDHTLVDRVSGFVDDEVDEDVRRSPQLDSSNREEMYYPSDGSHEQVLHVQHLHGIHTYGSSSTASKRDQARGRSGNVSMKILTT